MSWVQIPSPAVSKTRYRLRRVLLLSRSYAPRLHLQRPVGDRQSGGLDGGGAVFPCDYTWRLFPACRGPRCPHAELNAVNHRTGAIEVSPAPCTGLWILSCAGSVESGRRVTIVFARAGLRFRDGKSGVNTHYRQDAHRTDRRFSVAFLGSSPPCTDREPLWVSPEPRRERGGVRDLAIGKTLLVE
jgi:hypothetical protein